jgi:hypothetical protein
VNTTTSGAVRSDALRYLAERVEPLRRADVDAIAVAMADEQEPGAGDLLHDEAVRQVLEAANRDHVLTLLRALTADPWVTPELPAASVDIVRTLARRGAPLSSVLGLFRTGARFLRTRFGLELLDGVPDDRLRAGLAALLWERSGLYLDATTDAAVRAFESERERWVTGALARRAEVVRELIDGGWVDGDEASMVLGHELRRHHTALVVWRPGPNGAGAEARRLEARVAEIATALGAGRALTLPAGTHSLWAWIGTAEPPARDALGALDAGGDCLVAVGRPGFGADGFRRSHREAVRAQRVAMRCPRPARVTRFEDVELLSLVSGDDEAMIALVRRELGPLAADDPATARLRSTLAAVQVAGGGSAAAAEALGVHRNTVLYRLRRIDELLGRPAAERRLELEVALRLADAFPDRVLVPAAETRPASA